MRSVKTGSDELGELIQRRRAELSMTRRQLVDATGLSYPYVSQIETGYRTPSAAAAMSLAKALAISVDRLLGEESEAGGSHPPPDQPLTAAMPTAQAIAEEALRLLAQLPPESRLEALSQVQTGVMHGLIGEGRLNEQRPPSPR